MVNALRCPQHSSHRSRRKLSTFPSVDEASASKYTQNGPALALMRKILLLPCSDCRFSLMQDCRCFVIPLPESFLLHNLQTPSDFIPITQPFFSANHYEFAKNDPILMR